MFSIRNAARCYLEENLRNIFFLFYKNNKNEENKSDQVDYKENNLFKEFAIVGGIFHLYY